MWLKGLALPAFVVLGCAAALVALRSAGTISWLMHFPRAAVGMLQAELRGMSARRAGLAKAAAYQVRGTKAEGTARAVTEHGLAVAAEAMATAVTAKEAADAMLADLKDVESAILLTQAQYDLETIYLRTDDTPTRRIDEGLPGCRCLQLRNRRPAAAKCGIL